MRIEIIKKKINGCAKRNNYCASRNQCPNLINQIYTYGINRFSYVSTGSTKMLTKKDSFWKDI